MTKHMARTLGAALCGGEVIELVGDVGSGKTTFTKSLAEGLGVIDDVQSPSFTLSRVYDGRDNLKLYHYDFYRLPDPGIMQFDLDESVHDKKGVTVVEWAETVADILPPDRVVITFSYGNKDDERMIEVQNLTPEMEEVYVSWS